LRYLNFSETLTVNTAVSSSHNVTTVFDQSLGLPTGNIPVLNLTQTNSLTSDKFATRNDFVGSQLGARGEQHWDRIWASGEARLALGLMSEHVSISGSTTSSSTTISTPTNSILLAGIPLNVAAGNTSVITTSSSIAGSGILSRPNTVGTHTLYVLAAVPSGSIKFGYDLVPNVASVWLGYDGMFISSVARAATQADSAGAVHQSSFWAQGADLGMKVRF
jgi:hypothetical protein